MVSRPHGLVTHSALSASRGSRAHVVTCRCSVPVCVLVQVRTSCSSPPTSTCPAPSTGWWCRAASGNTLCWCSRSRSARLTARRTPRPTPRLTPTRNSSTPSCSSSARANRPTRSSIDSVCLSSFLRFANWHWTLCLPLILNSKVYLYSAPRSDVYLELNGNRRRLTWEAVPRSIHEGVQAAIATSDCLVFDHNIAQVSHKTFFHTLRGFIFVSAQ